MSDPNATEPQGSAIAPAETEVVTDAQVQGDESETTEESDAQPEGGDSIEVEYGGKKYQVPAALRDAVMHHADYTQKTQKLSEDRRTLESQFQERAVAQDAFLQDQATLTAVNAIVASLSQQAQAAFNAGDRDGATNLWLQYQQAKETQDTLKTQYEAKVNQKHLQSQREAAEQLERGRAILQRDIKDWSPAVGAKLTEYAIKDVGLTPQAVQAISNGVYGAELSVGLIKLAHRAYLGDQAIKKAAAFDKLKAQEDVQPAPKVGGKASTTATLRPDSPSGDRLPADEWLRRRNAQLRKA